ncbi:hypothetical protein B0T26DRAFT_655760 [Lasiosphaeria miniovina]|uniref:Tyrosinase copper-binding domain-containing protein n=1 Tax=Lasiosphaeria miniovina TaxID=1954250 RepID=A0AA39ZYT2_9PEZI|nr:uncharacterized protein B0T26DRAFT_655760 [Lasiosphaeria miniovina]KAK0706120.1 hypothetical protein B0T26DRAFT_655760 [Lasiosphaeria miniovina]
MNYEKPSYRHFIQSRCQTNPCIIGLAEHVGCGSGAASTIVTLDYPQSGPPAPSPLTIAEANLAELIYATSTIHGRILIVENIRPHLISLLGEILDIDPIFFAGHITTDFKDIEKAPPPPSLALFPSQIAERGYLHLHYQQVLDLGSIDPFRSSSYSLKSDSNIPRNIRRLPHLSERQLALARACCSVLVKKIKGSWICLILVDPAVKTIIETLRSGDQKAYPSMLLHGGFEDFVQSASFASFTSVTTDRSWDKESILSSLIHYFRNQPPGFAASEPSILSLGYYPIRIVLAEWILYTHLMSRYFKYYEYTLHGIENRLHDSDIIDLQRWRRRSMQSQHKLILLSEFVDYWLPQEADKQPWNLIRKDIKHVLSQIEHYHRSLEHTVPVATSMVQLLDSRRWMLEAANVSRLTFIALVFVPLSWVASVFSMSENYSPGHENFWVYFATALPVLFLVLILSAVQWDQVVGKLKETAALLSQ